MLQHHGHFPETVLVVLAKDSLQRSTWRVMDENRRIEDDTPAGQPNAEVEFVVLVPPQRLVEETYAGEGLWPERSESRGIRVQTARPPASNRKRQRGGS